VRKFQDLLESKSSRQIFRYTTSKQRKTFYLLILHKRVGAHRANYVSGNIISSLILLKLAHSSERSANKHREVLRCIRKTDCFGGDAVDQRQCAGESEYKCAIYSFKYVRGNTHKRIKRFLVGRTYPSGGITCFQSTQIKMNENENFPTVGASEHMQKIFPLQLSLSRFSDTYLWHIHAPVVG